MTSKKEVAPSSALDAGGSAGPRRGRLRAVRPRRLVVMAAAVVVAVGSLTVFGAGFVTSLSGGGSAVANAAPVCQDGGLSGCTASLPCSTSTCPTAQLSQTAGLSDGQYVEVTATNFPSGDTLRIALCSTLTSTTDPVCIEGQWENDTYGPVAAPVIPTPDGTNTTAVAVPVFYQAGGEDNTPIPGKKVTGGFAPLTSFYCDDMSDPCALEITEETGTGNNADSATLDSSSNTLVYPLTYEVVGSGCSSTDQTVNTESSYSLEHFIPTAVDATCGDAKGVIDVNTTTDNQDVASDFASSGTEIGFIDAPNDPSVEGALLGNGQFAYIPIAVSGTAVGSLGVVSAGDTAYNFANYDMTPTMVAGMITDNFDNTAGQGVPDDFTPYTIQDGDNLIGGLTTGNPSVPCSNLVGCTPTGKGKVKLKQEMAYLPFNAPILLNPGTEGSPPQGAQPAGAFGSFNSSVSSGSSYQATDWICNAPKTAFTVDVNEVVPTTGSNPVPISVTDPNLASTTLTTASPDGNTLFPSCQATSDIPTLSSLSSGYSPSEAPQLQAKSMRSWAYGGGQVPSPGSPDGSYGGGVALGIMDSSEASFYGLDTASLENAEGQFVAPTASGLEAAEADLTACTVASLTCPAGTYRVDYSTQTDGAYPMPDVTYAIVPTTPQQPQVATAMTDLLTNLITYSHSSPTLPKGYAPLSDTLYQAALSDIPADITSAPVTTPTTGTTPPTTTSSGKTNPTTTPSGTTSPAAAEEPSTAASPFGQDVLGPLASTPFTSPTLSGQAGSSPGRSVEVESASGATVPAGFLLVSLDDPSRYLLPALVLLGLLCLVAGPLLLWGPALRRRRRGVGGQR
jgi:hypothetical protein